MSDDIVTIEDDDVSQPQEKPHHSNGRHIQEVLVDQSEDFIGFTFDGTRIVFDLYEADEMLARIDLKHRDDPWYCSECFHTFTRGLGEMSPTCPNCKKGTEEAPTIRRDESYLDDVATYIKGKGVEQVGRRAAAAFYSAILATLERVKKKLTQTPPLHSGMESIPAIGAEPESVSSLMQSLG